MTYLIQVSTCWIVFYLIYLALLGKETFFNVNRYYLLGTLLIGLCIPILAAFFPVNTTSTEIYQVIQQLEGVQVLPDLHEGPKSIISWNNLFLAIYLIGAFVVFLRFVYGLVKIFSIYKSAKKTTLSGYILVESSQYHLPFSFFKYIFISNVLPLKNGMDKIIKHEELHVNQWHSLDIIFTELLQVFFWFNPILLFYKKALKQSHEYLADAYVTKDHNKSSYGQLLLRQSTSGLEIALANQFFHSQIRKRIKMMYKEKSKKSALVKYLSAIPVLLAMLFIFSSSSVGEINEKSKDQDLIQMSNIGSPSFETETTFSNFPVSSLDKVSQDDPIFKVVEEMPRFPGCENSEISLKEKNDCSRLKLLEYISTNLKYPRMAMEEGVEGTVVISFIIEKDGSISSSQIIRDIGGDCGLASLNLVKSMPRWIAGKQGGKQVRVQFNLPMKYKLTDQTESISDKEKSEDLEKAAEDFFGIKDKIGKEVFKVVEEMPRFPGCEDIEIGDKELVKCAQKKMLEFISNNVNYPKAAKDAGISGMAVVKMIILEDGSIDDVQIVRNPGSGMGEEAERVIKMMPNWIPGKQRSKNVSVQLTLPIKFSLDNDEGEKKNRDVAQQNKEEKQPLIIIDGIEYKRGTIEDLQADRIKSVNVIKGESALIIYGDRAKNGVIEIEMKDGYSVIEKSSVSQKLVLHQNEPNPFVGVTTIGYELEEEGEVQFTIYNIAGAIVKELRAKGQRGYNKIEINSNDLDASGVLYYTLKHQNTRETRKMMINN